MFDNFIDYIWSWKIDILYFERIKYFRCIFCFNDYFNCLIKDMGLVLRKQRLSFICMWYIHNNIVYYTE